METSNHNTIRNRNPVGTRLLVAVISSVFTIWAAADPPPDGGDGKGISVRLELPWETLNFGENIQYRYILENASDRPIPVAFPCAESKFGWPNGGQPYLEGIFSIPGQEPARLSIHRSSWPPTGLDDEGIEAWGELPAGSRIILNQNRMPSSDFGVYAGSELQAIQAHWLIGPKRWISSKPVPVRVVKSSSGRTRAFEAEWSSYGWGKDRRRGTAYTIPVEDSLFLFWEGWRVTEVSPDDRFEHQIDKDGTNLEITITGSKGVRKVYVHLRHALTRDSPWPIGPVSLFYPEPEPIPPAELAALRKAAFPEDFHETGNSRPERKPGSQTSVETAESEKTPRGGFPAWTLAAVLALLVGTVMFIVRRMRAAA